MPTSSHFCLGSETYKNIVFEGFSRLQQSDEFVDMTLAAEGHLVKVHKTLIALASPYLKEMLKSVPCQHPVLFLNNVSHEVLCLILEYIYTGEVNIPSEMLKTFLNVAQSMHISGLSNIIPPRDHKNNNFGKKEETTIVSLDPRPSGIKACITNENDFNLQVQPNPESSNSEAENGQTVSESTSNLPLSEENNQLLRPINVNNETLNNSVAINISENNTGFGNRTQDTSNMDISDTDVSVNNDTIQIPMIIEGQLQQLYAKPLFNTNEGTVNNDESSNNDTGNEQTEFESAINLPASEENNQLLEPIDVNNETSNNIVAININENNTQDTASNMDISNTVVSVNSGTIPIPIVIGGQLQQIYAKPLFNMANEETVNTNLINSNQTSKFPTDFSNLFNIASSLNLPQRHDLPGHITITELPDCNKDATPTTNEVTEVSEVVENQEQSDATGDKNPDSVLYTISNRGSLQMIMNRFMYYTHYQRNGGRHRRWRCIEYRSKHCIATFDTNDGIIVSRKHKHCHPNHDKKIWQKVMQNKIFNTIKMAEDVMEKKQKIPEPVVLSDSESSENK